MIVVDASSISKLVLQEEHWEEVEEYLRGNACSLDYAVLETTSAIWKEHVLRKRITETDAANKLEALMLIAAHSLSLDPSVSYLKEGLRIATRKRIAIYDAIYIAQARKYGKLLTSDEKQAETARSLDIDAVYIR